jgi:hypothetical protein
VILFQSLPKSVEAFTDSSVSESGSALIVSSHTPSTSTDSKAVGSSAYESTESSLALELLIYAITEKQDYRTSDLFINFKYYLALIDDILR